jgi:putative heme-binding domain-containing protein
MANLKTVVLFSVSVICNAAMAGEIERWADKNLTVHSGLLIWLDAHAQVAATQAYGRPAPYSTGPFDVWYDASGNGLNLMQRIRDAQPRFIQTGNRAVVRFDGKDDFLELTQPGRSLDVFTVFIVAAPRSNAGGFRAFLAAHEAGKNDYTTGFTIDMFGFASAQFNQLNVEGRGFSGAANLLKSPLTFGEFHAIEVVCQPGAQGVRALIDGVAAGQRPREAGPLRLDGISLGARCYSNTADPPSIGSFLDGDIAEVILYDRILNKEDAAAVRQYLKQKHTGLTEAIAVAERHGGRLLKPIENPPLVQMLLPGFTVHELPVDLTNLNNVRYRPDGKLFALAYDGNIYLLADDDGDGLEETVKLFFDSQGRLRGPIGIALTPPNYEHGSGLFVASKGKVSLIVDRDGDDRADVERVVATGWKEIAQNVDALATALAPDGSLYFALGTANYANGYLLDPGGKSHYELSSERGTVLKVSPDFSKREIVCTGVRFPIAMAFNRHGDLFATDQEGATWLPNGNPFDELLHIQPGRHYGFPPRHPRHNPNVLDEPSVFDYGPQHQSTCGMVFNESVGRGRVFGPSLWTGDAIVCGESRGKLFRTKLAKTPAGYVASNQTIACLSMLTVDACVSPAGDLVVACHSGPPDWGTGPQGKGKLFKIHYTETVPQPVIAWAAGRQEVRIAFDRPLDPTQLKNLARQVSIEYGPYVGAGDRFESLKPPYAVVQQQFMTPRYDLAVHSAQVTADSRTIILATAPHDSTTHFAVTLPRPAGTEANGSRGPLDQFHATDLHYDLNGVSAQWEAGPASVASKVPSRSSPTREPASSDRKDWSGWLPHVDLEIARQFCAGSAEHDQLWPLLKQPGTLTLRTQLDLWQMLRPAIQPGASIDWTPAAESVTVSFRSSQPFQLWASDTQVPAQRSGSVFVAELNATPQENQPVSIQLKLASGTPQAGLEVSWNTAEDKRPRALPLRRMLQPWANAKPEARELLAARSIPELAGGDWSRGRSLFTSELAACSKCHTLRGQGGRIGPDLSNLPHRDYHSVRRDILQPSATINPDHISYSVAMKDGRVLAGVPVSSDDRQIIFGDSTGKETVVSRSDIDELKPSSSSGMPDDMGKKLSDEQLRDLLTFLLTEPLEPAKLERRDAPPPRRREEVDRVLSASSATPSHGTPQSTRRLHIALVAGPKDHGPGEHDYPLWQSRWSKLLALAPNVEVSTSQVWPSREQLDNAHVIVFFSANPGWNADRAADLDAFLGRGGGLVYLHFAVNGGKAVESLADRIGLAAHGGIKYRHGPLTLRFPDAEHPITRGFGKLPGLEQVDFVDESYWNMPGDPGRIHTLATAVEEDRPRPLLWTLEHGKGRVFVNILGHYNWTFDDPLFRILLLRGMAWTAGEPADRMTELATIGARIEP